MCGIAGLINFDRRPVEADLAEMSRRIAHRGPDQEDIWSSTRSEHAIGLAHRRLSIRDLTDSGRQPLESHSGRSVLIYNGELYNEGDLTEKLRRKADFIARSRCDSEVLLECLEQFGPRCVGELNGIYAFACHDRKTGETILARDPVGVKPLYVWKDPTRRCVAFASEVKAFLGLRDFQRKIDDQSLLSLLTQGYVGPSRSLMRDVISLAPGQVLKVSAEGEIIELQRVAPAWAKAEPTDEFNPARLKSEFESAVARQRVSDVPLAVWQSAGIDSSLVNAALSEPRPQSLIFSNDVADFDEMHEAEQIAIQLGSMPVTVSFDDGETPAETFASIVWHMDGELADSSALAVKKLAAATKPLATVVLSGDGADELFGGYETYRATRLASRINGRIPPAGCEWLSRQLLNLNSSAGKRYPAVEFAARFFQGLPSGRYSHTEWRRYGMPWLLTRIVTSQYRSFIVDALAGYRSAIDLAHDRSPNEDAAVWGQNADLAYYLPGDMLMKVDRMSMAHGLEVRVPFLDLQFAKYVATIPPQLRLPSKHQTKPLLRNLLASYGLPSNITTRKKTGFNVPLAHRLRTDYKDVMENLLVRENYVAPYLNPMEVRHLASDHMEGRANHAYILWAIMTFAQWRRHLEQ